MYIFVFYPQDIHSLPDSLFKEWQDSGMSFQDLKCWLGSSLFPTFLPPFHSLGKTSHPVEIEWCTNAKGSIQVEGQSQCSSLPSAVYARLLAHLVSPGPGEIQVRKGRQTFAFCFFLGKCVLGRAEGQLLGGAQTKGLWSREEEGEGGGG